MTTAFEYLVERIVSRRCVPLIGAGISMGARRGGAKWTGHHVTVMIEKVLVPTLMARIARTLGAPPDVRRARICASCQAAFADYHLAHAATCTGICMTCDLREARLSRALTKVCEAFLWEHGGPNQESTYRKLVQFLEIEKFADLEPTPAHYYLAFLAREGLLSEVVTTNYDCNLEHACDATWADSTRVRTSEAYRIYDLNSFAANAARSSRRLPGGDTAHALKVYKVNGCAKRLMEDARHAVDILLTASQLQDWRARRWAADFFRTKIRTSSLVTIGFGSDEPQVVHTLQQVLEEFSGITSENPSADRSVFDASNAPIVTTYDYQPSFPQLQLVNGFAAWWAGNAVKGSDLVIGPYQRVLKSAPSASGVEPQQLRADVLWAEIFHAVFGQLLAKHVRDSAVSGNAAFTSAVPYASQGLSLLAEQLERDMQAAMSEPTALSHWLTELEGEHTGETAVRPHLTRCITHLVSADPCRLRYTALADHGPLYTELALLLSVLHTRPEGDSSVATPFSVDGLTIWQRVLVRAQGVLEVIVPGVGGGTNESITSVFVSCARTTQFRGPLETEGTTAGARRLEVVIGGGHERLTDLDRKCIAISADGQTPSRLIRLDWKAIFPPELPVRSYSDLRIRLMDAVRFPTKYRRRVDPSIRSNRFLQLASGGK
ncbi:SIR2 family protein [Burkholderia cepacia]|uniref:SIR2 family protein n=1 Tax=Burkholderia cepacia TaxID=292 RepID=UPI00158EFA9E|nr:SIR2 family protein [Burkholderia cepacia]